MSLYPYNPYHNPISDHYGILPIEEAISDAASPNSSQEYRTEGERREKWAEALGGKNGANAARLLLCILRMFDHGINESAPLFSNVPIRKEQLGQIARAQAEIFTRMRDLFDAFAEEITNSGTEISAEEGG